MDSDEIDETTLSTVEVFKIPTQDEFDRDFLESLDIDSEEGIWKYPSALFKIITLWDFPPFNDVSAWINHPAINDHEDIPLNNIVSMTLDIRIQNDCYSNVAYTRINVNENYELRRRRRKFGWRQPEPALPPASHKEMHMHIRRTAHLVDDVMQGYIDLWDNRAANIVTGEPDADGSYLDPYYSRYNTVTRKRIQPPLYTPETYRPSGHEHYLLVASLVRTCKMSAIMFFKTTDKEVKRQLHDMFHATRADLLKIGEGRALDVDNEDLDLPHDTFDVGPSQVTQAESQRGPLRRRLMPPWQHYATMSGIWGAKDHLSFKTLSTRAVIDELTKMIRQFWWNKKEGGKGISWLKQEILQLKKFEGGMSFKDLKVFNEALLLKITWRMVRYLHMQVSKILAAKYCHNDSIFSARMGSSPSHIWRGYNEEPRVIFKCRHEPALPLKPRFDPTRVTLLSWSPRAFHYKGFLSDKECDHLISLTNGRLGKSMVADSKTGKGVESKVRTSSGTFLDYAQDEIVADIEARIATWTFLPIENGEAMQVLRYELGQKYEPHRDYFTDKHNQRFGGHRVATVLMYLSNVIKGGETIFPLAEGGLLQQKGDDWSDCAKRGYAVKPRKGDALLFFGLHLNGTTDPKSLHGSCPVIEGEKWSATKWIRVRPLFMPDASCTDENEHCPDWAVHGECERNSNYMVGVNNTGGHCMKSCGVCSDTA
ncbi:unnamed protein product [Rhodiola kirilowii]